MRSGVGVVPIFEQFWHSSRSYQPQDQSDRESYIKIICLKRAKQLGCSITGKVMLGSH